MLLNCSVGEDFWESLGLQGDPTSPSTIHPKGDQSCVFIERTDVEAETPILWPPDVKSWLIWKDTDAGKDWGSVKFSHSVMSNSLQPHELQHARPPCHHQLLEFTQTTSIELVMPSSHLILCRPLLLLPPIPPSIRVFSNESTLHMRWPKYILKNGVSFKLLCS